MYAGSCPGFAKLQKTLRLSHPPANVRPGVQTGRFSGGRAGCDEAASLIRSCHGWEPDLRPYSEAERACRDSVDSPQPCGCPARAQYFAKPASEQVDASDQAVYCVVALVGPHA